MEYQVIEDTAAYQYWMITQTAVNLVTTPTFRVYAKTVRV
jgi:hypothetical protein